MKKYLIPTLALAAMSLASCSQTELEDVKPSSKVAVTFSTELPKAMDSRSVSKGETANRLSWAVYRQVGTDWVKAFDDNKAAFAGTATSDNVSLSLISGDTYKIVFWADYYDENDLTPYTFTANDNDVVVENSFASAKTLANDDRLDAFYNAVEITVSGPDEKTVELKRPFAQINFGTLEDVTKITGLDVSKTQITVTGQTYSRFSPMTGKVDPTSATDVTYALNDQPEESTLSANNTTYNYVGFTYVLADAEKGETLTSVELLPKSGDTHKRTYTNIPVRANYRTNIVGNLFTSTIDYTVEIVPQYDGDHSNIELKPWDGTTKSKSLVVDETTQTISIQSAPDFALLADVVNNGADYTGGISAARAEDEPNSLKGYTITLYEDLDLGGHEWTPIGNGKQVKSGFSGPAFEGTFDGNGHTIKGLKISKTEDADAALGFFGVVNGGVVKGITFTDVDINVPTSKVAGAAVGLLVGDGNVNNVEVHGNISALRGNGGIVGRMLVQGTIANCTNYASLSATAANVGGIIGAAYYSDVDKQMFITDCINYGDVISTNYNVGGIVGLSAAITSGCENHGKIVGNGSCVGGIEGEHQNAGSISNCINYSDIKNNSTSESHYGTGGIVGWVRYSGKVEDYKAKNVIDITNCTNKGSIYGANNAGGIAGTVYHYSNVTGNTNEAEHINALIFAGGIVGNLQFGENVHPGMDDPYMITVKGNTTTTTDINATYKDYIGYDNSTGQYTTIENNTVPAEPKQEMTWSEFCTLKGIDTGSESATTINIDGENKYAITDWVDAWYGGSVTIKNMTFEHGLTLTARADGIVGKVLIEGCTFGPCSWPDIVSTLKEGDKQYTTDGKRLDNAGDGLCLDIDTKNSPNLEVEVINNIMEGENDITLPRKQPRINDGNNPKGRGHAVAINAIAGGGTAKSVLIKGNNMTGIRGNAIQLYTFNYPITVQDNKINSWGRNSGTGNFTDSDFAMRGDLGASGSLTLSNNYFGMDEELNDHIVGSEKCGVGHIKIGGYSGNTPGDRVARTY